jgi:hypothetical protein
MLLMPQQTVGQIGSDFDSTLYVQRESVFKLVIDSITKLKTLPHLITANSLINIWGVGGIGKTWFLKYLFNFYTIETASLSSQHERPLIVFLHEFDAATPNNEKVPKVVRALFDKVRESVPELNLPSAGVARELYSIEGMIELLADHMKKEEHFGILLLLDTDGTNFAAYQDELEWRLLGPLLTTNHAIAVVTARVPTLLWKTFELRRRLTPTSDTHLTEFDRDQVAKQIELLEKKEHKREKLDNAALDTIYRASKGSPHLVRDSYYSAGSLSDSHPTLSKYEDRLLEHVAPDLRNLLEKISVFRFFRPSMLQEYFRKTEDQTYSSLYYQKLSNDLRAQTQVLQWDDRIQAFRMDPIVRRVLNSRLAKNDLVSFKNTHEHLFQLHEGWYQKFSSGGFEFIPEMFYHCSYFFTLSNSRVHFQQDLSKIISLLIKRGTKSGIFEYTIECLEQDGDLPFLLPLRLHKDLPSLVQNVFKEFSTYKSYPAKLTQVIDTYLDNSQCKSA